MQIQPKSATSKNPATQFVGDVWLDRIASPQDDGQHMVVAKVRFAPGARSNWHSHILGQTLYVTEGIGLVQSRGGAILEIRPGDVIYTPPGEEHWHGATPDDFMEHLALLEGGDNPATSTTWLEPVSDAEYHRP